MKIGIIGAGQVGSTLGLGWSHKGHEVTFGVNDPAKYASLEKEGNIKVKKIIEVVKTHELIVLTVPGQVVGKVVSEMGNLKEKIIIDTTNMFGMNKLKEIAPSAYFVKAFNHIGFNIMANPDFNHEPATVLLCGDQNSANEIVATLAKDLGFFPIIAGDSSLAPDIENFALLWIKLSRKIGRNFAFKLLTR